MACECAICTSNDPKDKRLRCSSCIETIDDKGQHRVILLDTSPDLRAQSLRHHLMRCDGIFFTHHHVDHLWGLDEVRRFNAVMQEPIDIFAEDRMMGNVLRVYPHIFEREKNVNDSFVASLIPHRIEPFVPIDRFGLRITPLRLLHGRLPIVGYRIERIANDGTAITEPIDAHDPLPLAYCTDVSSIPPETWPHLRNLRTLLLDMLRPRHHPTHLTVDQAIEIADQIGATDTAFIHMTHNILHAELNPQLPSGMQLGYDGLTFGSLTTS